MYHILFKKKNRENRHFTHIAHAMQAYVGKNDGQIRMTDTRDLSQNILFKRKKVGLREEN